jgi:hypothetical protein
MAIELLSGHRPAGSLRGCVPLTCGFEHDLVFREHGRHGGDDVRTSGAHVPGDAPALDHNYLPNRSPVGRPKEGWART